VDLTGMAPKYTDGKISSLAGLHDSPDRFQVSVPIQPGNSGGPLVDMAGDVVGVVVASLSDLVGPSVSGALPQNVNYAVTGSRLAALARVVPELRGKLKTPGSNPVQNPRDAAKRVEDASALVIAY